MRVRVSLFALTVLGPLRVRAPGVDRITSVMFRKEVADDANADELSVPHRTHCFCRGR